MSDDRVSLTVKLSRDTYNKVKAASQRVLYNAPVEEAIVTIVNEWLERDHGVLG